MAEHKTFYQKVEYYDVVFDRDVTGEVDFLLGAAAKRLGHQPQSAMEIACGPAYHAREMARRGIRSGGFDLSPEMIAIAKQKDADEGIRMDLFAADMRDFKLKKPVDLIYIVFDGIDALNTNADLVAHLKTVAKNLTNKGIYIIDQTHPRDISVAKYGNFRYQGKRDGTEVDIRWATNDPPMDPITGISKVEIEIHVKEKGKKSVIHDSASERYMTANEVQLLADLSGKFNVADWYGDFNLNQPMDLSPKSRRMITVMQKK